MTLPVLVTEPPVLWTPPEGFRVVALTHPFRSDRLDVERPEGGTIADILAELAFPPWAPPRVWLDGVLVPPTAYARVRPRKGHTLTVRAWPTGGESDRKTWTLVIAIVAIIVVTVVTWGVGFVPSIAAFAPVIGALAGAAVGIGGTLLLNSLIPPPKPKLADLGIGGQAPSPTYSVTGTRNLPRPYGVIPRIYGRHKFVPVALAPPMVENAGLDQYVIQAFGFGYGPLSISDLKIGDTPIAAYGVEHQIAYGWPGEPPLTLYPWDEFEEAFSVHLTYGLMVERTTRPNTERFIVHLVAPQGQAHIEADGSLLQTLPVTIRLEYKRVDIPGQAYVLWLDAVWHYMSLQTIRFSFFGPVLPLGQYTVRVTRLTIDYPYPPALDEIYWAGMRSERFQDPVQMQGMCKIVIRIKATEQLNGVIDTLNAIVGSYVGARVDGVWGAHQSSNPAWIYLDVLLGGIGPSGGFASANARPVPQDQIDFDAFYEWAAVCDAQGYSYCAVHDFRSTVAEVLHDIAAAGRATPHRKGALYSILRDAPQTIPVQHLTPRNSWGFSATKAFPEPPHALKVRYINPLVDWQQDEQLVFDDGYNETNATRYEVFELFGITDAALAWRHGRYFMASAKLRPERYTLSLDIENLVATRGDLVRVTHDVPLWGSGAARIHRIITSTEFELDDLIEELDTPVWRVARIRTSDGASVGPITISYAYNPPDKATTVLGLVAPGLPASVQPGDLVLVGENGKESVECIVTGVECHPDFSATLTLADAAPGIAQAETGPIPPFDTFITRPLLHNRRAPAPPQLVSIRSDQSAMGGGQYQDVIDLTLAPGFVPDALPATHFQIEYRVAGAGTAWLPGPTVPAHSGHAQLRAVGPLGTVYEIRARAFNSTFALASVWLVLTHQIAGADAPLPPFDLQLTPDMTHLRWQHPLGAFRGVAFAVRYTANYTGGIWETAHAMHGGLMSDTRFAVPPIPTGRYLFFVKAYNPSGVASLEAARLDAPFVYTPPGAELTRWDYTALGYPGTKVGLVVGGTAPDQTLCTAAGATSPFWHSPNTGRFWAPDRAVFWSAEYMTGSYTIDVQWGAGPSVGGFFRTEWTATSGSWYLEYTVMQPGFVEGPWAPFPGAIKIVLDRYYRLRWVSSGPAQACLSRVLVIVNEPPPGG